MVQLFLEEWLQLLQELGGFYHVGVDVVSFYAVLFFFTVFIFTFLNIFSFYKYYNVYIYGLEKKI